MSSAGVDRLWPEEIAAMKNDLALRHDVLAELDWDPRIDSRNIGAAVKNGVVSLTGRVGSYAERRVAQEAVQSIAGVKAVANDIVIELSSDAPRPTSGLWCTTDGSPWKVRWRSGIRKTPRKVRSAPCMG
jgi:hypothetical protein